MPLYTSEAADIAQTGKTFAQNDKRKMGSAADAILIFSVNILFKNVSSCGIHFIKSIRYYAQYGNVIGLNDIRKDLIPAMNAAR